MVKKYYIKIYDIPNNTCYGGATELHYENGILDFLDRDEKDVIIRTDSWIACEE